MGSSMGHWDHEAVFFVGGPKRLRSTVRRVRPSKRGSMEKRIVLISCVSKKLSIRAKAKDLYVSTLFKLNLQYAIKLEPDHIFILSAKYGLLPLDKKIEPYEKTLNKMSAIEIQRWAYMVLDQIRKVCVINETKFIFLAGERYRKYLLPHINDASIPLKGLGIGKQLKKLKELVS